MLPRGDATLTRARAAAVLAVFLATPRASAVDQKPSFPSDVELVYVTVTVVDDKGAAVQGLTRADFTIIEDNKPRAVEVFAAGGDDEAAPDVSLLVDTSGSVSTYTEKMTFQALKILERIPKLHRASVLSFDNDVRVWHADAGPGALVRDMMAARRENGATALHTALVTALEQLEAPAPRVTMILISDGEDVGSRVTANQALEALKRSHVTIYPLTHGAERPLSMPHGLGVQNWGQQHRHTGGEFLRRLADMSGGRVFTPDDGDFEHAIDAILAEVASQYVLGFAPASSARAATHKLKVQVNRKDLKVRYRSSYDAAGRG
jgi:VWFA-related protein